MTELIKSRTDSLAQYGEYEYHLTSTTILPFLRQWDLKFEGAAVVDVGCGAGGSSQVFTEAGASTVGIDIDPERIAEARRRAQKAGQNITFYTCDVHTPPKELLGKFDLAIVRDVIEHVAQPELFLAQVRSLLRPQGLIFLSFPPYYSAYGGHQHHPKAITRFLPWSHILPRSLFRRLLPEISDYQAEIFSLNKITIRHLEVIIQRGHYTILRKQYFLVRPALHFKYGLPVLKAGFIGRISWIRELLTTGAFYLLQPPGG